MFVQEAKCFLDAVNSKKKGRMPCSLEDAKHVLCIINSVIESSDKGKEYTIGLKYDF